VKDLELVGFVVAEGECFDEEEWVLKWEGDCFFCDLEEL
jgi:hypothetical protein